MDSIPDGKIPATVTQPENLNDSYGHLPTIGSNLPTPALTPPLVISPLRTQGFSFNNELTSRPVGAQFHSGDHSVDNVTSTLASMHRKDAVILESISNNNSFEFDPREPLIATNLSAPKVSVSTDSSNIVDGISRHTESSKTHSYIVMNVNHPNQIVSSTETYVAAQESCIGMNSGYEDCDFSSQFYPCSMTSSLQSAETYKMRMVNEYSGSNDRKLVEDLKAIGLAKANNYGQYTYIAKAKSTTKDTSTSAELSAVNGGKTNNGFSVKTSIADSNHPNQLSISDKEQNQEFMNHLLISVGSSDYKNTCLKDEKSKNASKILKVCETKVVEDAINSKHEVENCSLGSRNSVVELSDSLPSRDPDEQTKSVAGKMFSVSIEKLWDGSLQLNTSTTVSAVAFFKSGEKTPDITWSDPLEVKGKVKLQAFEKFIQELPRSRTRALMVISLCWKAGSSKSGLKGMKEVANGYKESKRVGIAQICPGIDLYVCPRSETIITILAKFGFFKGMAAVEEDPNSLIGCVVWRRSCQSLNSTSKASDGTRTSLAQQQLSSSKEILENSSQSKNQDEHSKQAPLDTREADDMPCQWFLETKSSNADTANHITEGKLELKEKSSSNCSSKSSIIHITPSLPYNSPIAPVQSCLPQKGELKSKECLKSSLSHAAEAKAVFDSEPAQPFPFTQILPESHQRNIASRENLNSSPDLFMRSAPPKPFGFFPVQQTVQRPYLSSQENPVANVSKTENYKVHFKESDTSAVSSKLTQTILPGPPPLPPDVLERIIQSRAAMAKGMSVGIINAKIPAEHVSEPKKSSMIAEPSPVLPGPPPLLPPGLHPPLPPGPPPSLPQTLKVSPSPVDVDDLPEFDFSSAFEVLKGPASKYPWSRPGVPDVPSFNKQIPSDLGDNPIPLGSSMQSIEVTQRQKFSPFPGDSGKNYQGNPAQTNFQKPILDIPIRNSLSYDQPCLDVDKCLVDRRFNSSYPRKRRWDDDDDDDDMPEWCPPDMQHIDQTRTITAIKLPSPVYNRNSNLARHHPFIHPPSSTSLCSPRSSSVPHGYMHSIRGPPLSYNRNPPVQTKAAVAFDHGIQKSPLLKNPTNLSSYQTSTSNKRHSDIPSRF